MVHPSVSSLRKTVVLYGEGVCIMGDRHLKELTQCEKIRMIQTANARCKGTYTGDQNLTKTDRCGNLKYCNGGGRINAM